MLTNLPMRPSTRHDIPPPAASRAAPPPPAPAAAAFAAASGAAVAVGVAAGELCGGAAQPPRVPLPRRPPWHSPAHPASPPPAPARACPARPCDNDAAHKDATAAAIAGPPRRHHHNRPPPCRVAADVLAYTAAGFDTTVSFVPCSVLCAWVAKRGSVCVEDVALTACTSLSRGLFFLLCELRHSVGTHHLLDNP